MSPGSSLPIVLLPLVYLRVAQCNLGPHGSSGGCCDYMRLNSFAFCVDSHTTCLEESQWKGAHTSIDGRAFFLSLPRYRRDKMMTIMVVGVKPSCVTTLWTTSWCFQSWLESFFFFRTCNNVLNLIMVTTLGISRVLFNLDPRGPPRRVPGTVTPCTGEPLRSRRTRDLRWRRVYASVARINPPHHSLEKKCTG